MKLRKCKKLLAVASMAALVGSVTAFADTYINEILKMAMESICLM